MSFYEPFFQVSVFINARVKKSQQVKPVYDAPWPGIPQTPQSGLISSNSWEFTYLGWRKLGNAVKNDITAVDEQEFESTHA